MDVKTLARSRLVLLLEQVQEERGLSLKAAAESIKLDQSYASKLTKGQARSPGLETLNTICQAAGLQMRFFTDPSLGESPDHRRFIGRRETHVERDDAEGSPAVEAYLAELADAGSPAPEEAARHLRGLRHSTGDVTVIEGGRAASRRTEYTRLLANEELEARVVAALDLVERMLDEVRVELYVALAFRKLDLRVFGDLVRAFDRVDTFLREQLGVDDVMTVLRRRRPRAADVAYRDDEPLRWTIDDAVRRARPMIESLALLEIETLTLPRAERVRAKLADAQLFVVLEDHRARYEDGDMSALELARAAGISRMDLAHELEVHGISRSAEVIRKVAAVRGAEMNRIVEQDRRARSCGVEPGSEALAEAVERSVVATQRLEGLDARAWARARRPR